MDNNIISWDAGLVISLSSSEGKALMYKLAVENGVIDEDDVSEFDSSDCYEIINRYCPNTTCYCCDGATVYYSPLSDDGTINFNENTKLDGDCAVITANTKFCVYGNPYRTCDELVEAFKAIIGNYLPDDFDYAGHIGVIVGCFYD